MISLSALKPFWDLNLVETRKWADNQTTIVCVYIVYFCVTERITNKDSIPLQSFVSSFENPYIGARDISQWLRALDAF